MKPANLSNRQLIRFISRSPKHALAGELEAELKKRNIDSEEVKRIHQTLKEDYQEYDKNTGIDLSTSIKALLICFPHSIPIYAIAAGILRSQGYEKKHSQYWRYMSLGLCFHITLLLVGVLIYRLLH